MIFDSSESSIAHAVFVEGMSDREAAKAVDRDRSTVVRGRQRILTVLKILGVNTDCPRDVADAVTAILRRQSKFAA